MQCMPNPIREKCRSLLTPYLAPLCPPFVLQNYFEHHRVHHRVHHLVHHLANPSPASISQGSLGRKKSWTAKSGTQRCTYAECPDPEHSSRYVSIMEGHQAGGHDWSSITGSVLCNACYTQVAGHPSQPIAWCHPRRPLVAMALPCRASLSPTSAQ